MKTWLRWILIVMSVGGGFVGLLITLLSLPSMNPATPFGVAVTLAFAGLYGFVMIAGLLFARDESRIGPLRLSLWLQVPVITSPLISWQFTSGFHITFGLIGGLLGVNTFIGSIWYFSLLKGGPWGVAVNLFAVLLLVMLAQVGRSRAGAPSTAEPGASVTAQIDSILAARLANTPLADRAIRLESLSDGGLSVRVGARAYPSVDEVPEEEIRTLIRSAVAEWETAHPS